VRTYFNNARPPAVPIVTKDEVEDLLHNKVENPFLLLDVREPEEVKAYQMIPGATNIPLGHLATAMRLEPKEFEQQWKFSKPTQDTKIVCYCRVRIGWSLTW
jgi:rhodanese-related sulfurtransferase